MSKILRRYTDVLSLLDMMRHGRLTLVPPHRWFDRTDALGLEQWGALMSGGEKDGQVYALCLAEGTEQAHHWQLFAGHSHGVCVQFDRDEFVEHLDAIGGDLRHGPVIYKSLTQLNEMEIEPDTLPFLKRDSFQAEKEYRVVGWEYYVLSDESFKVRMPPSMIKKVVLGPQIPKQLADTLRELACEQTGCAHIKFSSSRINNSASWNKGIAGAVAKYKAG